MIPVIRWTLRQRRVSTMWWSISVGAFIFINLVVYPSFKNQAAVLNKSLQNLPSSTVQLFGGSTDFFSPVGFMNSKIFFLMLPLLLSILAISLGSSLLAREEQDHTIETLLARPLSREKLLGGKALAGLIIICFVTVVSLIITVVMNNLLSIGVATDAIAVATLSCLLLAISTGALAFLLTATGRARAAAMGIATLLALGGYLISSLSGTVDWLKIPSKIFPFHYYHSEAILHSTFEWKYLLFFGAVIVGCGVLSWAAFRRRDLS